MEIGYFSPMDLLRERDERIGGVVCAILESISGGVPLEDGMSAKTLYNHAYQMELAGDLPEFFTAQDVYENYVGYSDGTDR